MARAISDEELQLKKRARRRLIGAVVLVTAIAVILPMVLDTDPKPVSQNVNIQIPSPDAGAYAPKGAPPADSKPAPTAAKAPEPAPPPVVAAPQAASPKSTEPLKSASPAANEPAPKEAAAAPTENPVAKPPPAQKAAKAAPPATDGKFVVQVAALADASRAKDLRQQAAGAGLKAYTEVVKTANGDVTRVRAGPYATREAADKALGQLKKAGLDGKVVPR
jgi:DedD protein